MNALPAGWVLGTSKPFRKGHACGAWLPGGIGRTPKAVVMGVGGTPEAAREDAVQRAWAKAGLQ